MSRRLWRPRFSVRTLLILVALLAITLARLAYLTRMAQLHTDIANGFVGEVCGYRQNPRDCVEYMINCNASKGRAFKWHRPKRDLGPRPWTFRYSNGVSKVIWFDDELMEPWENAVTHKVIAARYDRAVYRPWTRVSEVVD
jgi:hypothetical protein